MGEFDVPIIFSRPDDNIIETLKKYKFRTEIWANLPTKLNAF